MLLYQLSQLQVVSQDGCLAHGKLTAVVMLCVNSGLCASFSRYLEGYQYASKSDDAVPRLAAYQASAIVDD